MLYFSTIHSNTVITSHKINVIESKASVPRSLVSSPVDSFSSYKIILTIRFESSAKGEPNYFRLNIQYIVKNLYKKTVIMPSFAYE